MSLRKRLTSNAWHDEHLPGSVDQFHAQQKGKKPVYYFAVIFAVCLLIGFMLISKVAATSETATYIIYNASIYTGDPRDSQQVFTAIAFNTKTGTILGIGDDTTILSKFSESAATQENAHGKAIVPGFIDSHTHLIELGRAESEARLEGCTSIDEVIKRLLPFYDHAKASNSWLRGRGWDQALLNPQKEFPTRFDLDQVFSDVPVLLERVDSHAIWVNTVALKQIGDLPLNDPEGGKIIRNKTTGEPTGIFIDSAMDLVLARLPPPTDEELNTYLQKAIDICKSVGITSVHYAGVDDQTIRVLKSAIDANKFDIRVYAMLLGSKVNRTRWCNRMEKDYKDKLTIRSVKLFMDGALGSRGAALLQPYNDDPTNRGLLLMSESELHHEVSEWVKCGYQVNTHAIGDRANRIVLNQYEKVMDELNMRNKDLRLRIEHAQVVDSSDFRRFAAGGIIASVQPTHATSDMHYAEDRLGHIRCLGAYAWRTFLDNGVLLALGSDFPVERPDPLLGFYAAITRQDLKGNPSGGWYPHQKLSRYETLVGFTHNGAFAAFQENRLGTLRVGLQADFVILSDDIMRIPSLDIPKVHVEQTWLGGKLVYKYE